MSAACVTDGCGAPVRARGLCHRCYSRERYRAQVSGAWPTGPAPAPTCNVPDRWTGEPCGLPAMASLPECAGHRAVYAQLIRDAS